MQPSLVTTSEVSRHHLSTHAKYPAIICHHTQCIQPSFVTTCNLSSHHLSPRAMYPAIICHHTQCIQPSFVTTCNLSSHHLSPHAIYPAIICHHTLCSSPNLSANILYLALNLSSLFLATPTHQPAPSPPLLTPLTHLPRHKSHQILYQNCGCKSSCPRI